MSGERRFVTAVFVLLAIALALVASRGLLFGAVAVVVAGLVVLVAVLGRDRVALLAMVGAFATAPMYKGIAPGGESTPITPTDLAFGLAVMLLLPTLLGQRIRIPALYLLGVLTILVTGFLATAFADDPLISALQLVQWLVVLVGLVVLIAVWAPSWRIVAVLLWSYVLGHMASSLYAPLGGAIGGRYLGLTHHANAFGEAGTMAFAALMYLWGRNRAVWYRLLVLGCMAVCVGSSIASGSRAATVVIAGLVVMIPIVERSAVRGFALALVMALGIAILPFVVGSSSDMSALGRLTGSANAGVADSARTEALDFGFALFMERPLLGNGFAEAIFVHSVPVGVLASVGVLGFLGYLLVLYTFARPIIGHHPERRLAYVAWAFIAITPTVPALEDRTLWVPFALGILVALRPDPVGDHLLSERHSAAVGETSAALSKMQPLKQTETA